VLFLEREKKNGAKKKNKKNKKNETKPCVSQPKGSRQLF
jgi:hypothetical protein